MTVPLQSLSPRIDVARQIVSEVGLSPGRRLRILLDLCDVEAAEETPSLLGALADGGTHQRNIGISRSVH
jgi:hypothetical protein